MAQKHNTEFGTFVDNTFYNIFFQPDGELSARYVKEYLNYVAIQPEFRLVHAGQPIYRLARQHALLRVVEPARCLCASRCCKMSS